jgi:hypothetical protein
MLILLAMLACGGPSVSSDGLRPMALADTGDQPTAQITGSSTAYSPCVTDASCDPGEACTTVPGFASPYCAPACDPESAPAAQLQACDRLEGVATTCLSTGRCARECGDPDSCPDALACQPEASVGPVCAGEELGQAGFYGTCTHPMTEGPDCPAESSCFGGSLLGIDNGVCLPWCDSGACPEIPEDVRGATPLCYDVRSYGFDHPMCVLLCVPASAECPDGQTCLDYGGVGICAPEGFHF